MNRVRISWEGEHGSIQLDYDDSKEQPLNGYGYGDPPIDNDALHTMLEVGLGYAVRKGIEKKQEVKSESNS